jgi:DNA processing protein
LARNPDADPTTETALDLDADPTFDFDGPSALPVASLTDAERLACLRLARTPSVGPATFRKLINRYGGAIEALAALPDLFARSGNPRARIASAAQAQSELEAAARIGARPVFTIEPGYPPLLALDGHPPPLLYLRGEIALLQRPCVAIVGSRKASAAGLTMARNLAQGLGAGGVSVVSGLARGVDKAAHDAALAWGTVAVVAGGADVIYPPEHAELHEAIASSGCVISEMPPGFRPRGKDFPRRNRIISGISLGVIVVEAAAQSGSLITARYALDQGRDVFAVPGHPLDPRAFGTNRLIQDGASLITSADDVLAQLRTETGFREPVLPFEPEDSPSPSAVPLPRETRAAPRPSGPPRTVTQEDRDAILAALGPAAISIDDVVRATGLPTHLVRTALMDLTLSGDVTQLGAQLVARTSNP